ERALVNAIVGLLATGGSTNHTIHLIAIAAAAGILIDWDDFHDLSGVVPLLARIYPNGESDVNHFQQAGGMAVLTGTLLDAGLLHADVLTMGDARGLAQYRTAPELRDDGTLAWSAVATSTRDATVLRCCDAPFDASGGLHRLSGNLGRAIIKVSAVKPEHRRIEAPALVFDEQEDLLAAFRAGLLERDFVAVLRFQGPQANGMPELHQLTPTLGVLQDRGFRVALCTDGRMSGASGKVPAAIHITPECARGGPLALVRNGDLIRLDADAGVLQLLVPEAELARRIPVASAGRDHGHGCGRELFAGFRQLVGSAESGAASFTPSHT
ncbi:MAG: dihydroxy-acid dehydratase, partial [Pseudohongiellaceae bacterium]